MMELSPEEQEELKKGVSLQGGAQAGGTECTVQSPNGSNSKTNNSRLKQ